MNVAVLGSDGFIGAEIVKLLKKTKHVVTGITRETYSVNKGKTFDVFINANGSSKKYLAELDPISDFDANVRSVYKSVFDFKFTKYIYLSTVDAGIEYSNYGFHKGIAERILQKYCYNLLMVRCGTVIGKKATKGVIFDLINNKPLYVSLDSTFQLITNTAIAEFVKLGVEDSDVHGIFTLTGKTPITVKEAAKILKVKPTFQKTVGVQYYNLETKYTESYFKLKSSEQYLKDILK